ncbi:MAG: N-acetylneuraminate synthase family protein [Rhodothermales bacterium]|nr:N-acetylneuraminate synthase family protein [Rhodothermales bacterium]
MSPVILHIGYHKTATTWLQNAIFPRIDEVHYAGRRAPDYLTARGGVDPTAFVNDLAMNDVADLSKLQRAFDDVCHPEMPTLLSHENLLRPYRMRQTAERIAALTKGLPRAIVLSIRRQDQLLFSRYTHDRGNPAFPPYAIEDALSTRPQECSFPRCQQDAAGICACLAAGVKRIPLWFYDFAATYDLYASALPDARIHVAVMERLSDLETGEMARLLTFIGADASRYDLADLTRQQRLNTARVDPGIERDRQRYFKAGGMGDRLLRHFQSGNRRLDHLAGLDLASAGYYAPSRTPARKPIHRPGQRTRTMEKTLNIAGIRLGAGHPVFVIAEAGVNHNGDPRIAAQLLFAARDAGARCVKFQTFKAERVASVEAPKAAYQLRSTDPGESQIDMLRRLELSSDAYAELMEIAEATGVLLLSTPYNVEDVDFLDDLGMPAFKLASLHVAEPYFLKYVARKGKPILLSTGMATLDEVSNAVDAIRGAGNDQLVLLQCTTNYPSTIEDTNLRAMQTMRDAFDVLVGYSDHTLTDTACIGAVALGACVIEKHFTLDTRMPGPDHASSVDPAAFRVLADRIGEAERMLGSGLKIPSEVEKKNAPGMRRSVYTRTHIRQGDRITPEMLTFKRPATGLAPVFFERLIGRVALCDIPANAPVSEDQVAMDDADAR